MARQLALNLCYEITLVDFISLLLLPTCNCSCLHGGRQCWKLHLITRKENPGVKKWNFHENRLKNKL